jgi:hypothetical protein
MNSTARNQALGPGQVRIQKTQGLPPLRFRSEALLGNRMGPFLLVHLEVMITIGGVLVQCSAVQSSQKQNSFFLDSSGGL